MPETRPKFLGERAGPQDPDPSMVRKLDLHETAMFPAVMKLLGHDSPDMTLLYLQIALPISSVSSTLLAPARAIWCHNRKLPPLHSVTALLASSSQCAPRNI